MSFDMSGAHIPIEHIFERPPRRLSDTSLHLQSQSHSRTSHRSLCVFVDYTDKNDGCIKYLVGRRNVLVLFDTSYIISLLFADWGDPFMGQK